MKNLNLKIAFFLPTLNIGGIERVFITYANYLVEKKYDVSFILCKKEGKLLSLLNPDVKLHDLGDVQLRYSFWKLRKCVNKIHPDVVISGGDFPNLVLVISSFGLKRAPELIISQHNYYNVETRRLGWWAYGTCLLMKLFYPKADKIIAVSNGIYKFLTENLHLAHDKMVILPNPIDVKEIKEKSVELLDVSLPDKYILFVGRLGYVKNLFFLLDAFERVELEDYHLVIVGDGEMRDALMDKAEKMRKADKVVFLGAIENPLPILRKSKLLVLPSFSEAYPTVLLEALCLYIPILSTPTDGAKEILNNIPGTYISNDCYDIDEFAQLMENGVQGCVDIQIVDGRISSNLIEIIGNRIQHEIINRK